MRYEGNKEFLDMTLSINSDVFLIVRTFCNTRFGRRQMTSIEKPLSIGKGSEAKDHLQ